MGVPTGSEYPGGGYIGGDPLAIGRVDLGGWLGRGWALFSAQLGVWLPAFFVYFVIILLFWLLWSVPTGFLEEVRQVYAAILNHTTPAIKPQNPFIEFARNQAFTLLLIGVMAVFSGGLLKMGLRQARGELISVAGLFSGFPHALPLLMVAVTIAVCKALAEALFMGLLHLAGLAAATSVSLSGFLVILPSLVLEGLLMFAPLLVLDRKATAAEALPAVFRC